MLSQLLELDIRNVPKFSLPSLPSSVESLSAEGGNEELLKSIVSNDNMYNLKLLCITSFTKLKELPVEAGTLSALEYLLIDYCDEMESLSEQLLQGVNSLRTLIVSACSRFKSLSDGMRHLSCLEELYITYCPQFVFPHNMNRLTTLRQLAVRGGNEKILDGLEGIPSLQDLYQSDFPSLTSLPDCLGAMTPVQVLQIKMFPKLSSLPDNFQQLRNLQRLTIEDCPMLEKSCKRGKGEDWHKIAHIANLPPFVEPTKPTISGNLIDLPPFFIFYSFVICVTTISNYMV